MPSKVLKSRTRISPPLPPDQASGTFQSTFGLRDVREVAESLSVSVRRFSALLQALGVPVLGFARRRFFNPQVLELAVLGVTFFGSPGLACPGDGNPHDKDWQYDLPCRLDPSTLDPARLRAIVDVYAKFVRTKSLSAETRIRRLLESDTMSQVARLLDAIPESAQPTEPDLPAGGDLSQPCLTQPEEPQPDA